jgi:UDP-glucose 4-epimerase
MAAGILRNLHPVGAQPSSTIGEAPSGMLDNLMLSIALVAAGTLSS